MRRDIPHYVKALGQLALSHSAHSLGYPLVVHGPHGFAVTPSFMWGTFTLLAVV